MIFALVGGVLLGALGLQLYHHRGCRSLDFVNPDLACSATDLDAPHEYAELQNALRATLARAEEQGEIGRAAIYFRDLRDDAGPVLGINEDAGFAPASLFKLPLAFVFFVLEEEHPGELAKKLLYTRSSVRDYQVPEQAEAPNAPLHEGELYPIRELVRISITNSDNLAFFVLLQYLKDQPHGRERFERTLREIGVVDPESMESETMSVHSYASLFRLLYNASYLSTAASNELLSWLGSSTYDRGLAAGIPKGTRLANKFGERLLDDGTKQLHDCGIVYHPRGPYVLCVMTKGRNFDDLRGVLSGVSRQVYEAVDESARARGPSSAPE